jgi:Spy/CpxP family protein refolding chaperone
MKRIILAAALCAALGAADIGAQPMMGGPGPHGPGPGGGVPSAEMLATIPDLTPAQQADVRRILTQQRDASEAAETKTRAQFEALQKQMRDDHERIETQTSDQLRKALGEDGFKKYAEWKLRRGPMDGGPHGDGPRGPRSPHGGKDGGPGAPPPPGTGAGKPDDE